MTENQKMQSDVIINIPGDEKCSKSPIRDVLYGQKSEHSADSPPKVSNCSISSAQKSPDIVTIGLSSNKPPKIPKTETLTRRKSLSRSVYSKPKSRFGEQSVSTDSKMFDENGLLVEGNAISIRGSPNAGDIHNTEISSVPVTPKTPLISIGGVDEDEEIYKKVSSRKKLKYRKVKAKVLIEWLLFLCVLGCVIATLTINKLQNLTVWGLQLWKWCVLVLVTFSGLLVSEWVIRLVVLLIELNYLLKKKVLYFVYGLKRSVRVFIWLGSVLFTWVLLFQEGVERPHRTTRILDFITWTIASLLVGSFLWLLKTLLLKILASSFHVTTFFDRTQESIFHQYILLTLSGPPVMDSVQMLGRTNSNVSRFSFRVAKKGKEGKEKKEKEVIDINKLHQMKQDKVSAYTMKMLVDLISNSGLTTLSNAIDESVYYGGNEQTDKEITNEEEAIAAAYLIFRNVAQPNCTYIDGYDLRRFMIKEEVEYVFPMIDVADTGKIDRKALTDWVVKWKSGTGVLCDSGMPHRLKGKFYRTAIMPALLYGTECWAVKQCHVQKMNVAQMRMLRWMCGHTKKDRLRNEVIREKVRVASIEDKMMENRLRWFGHVRRRPVDAPVRRLESWGTSNIVKGRGRSKKTWIKWIENDMRFLGIGESMAMERQIWRERIRVVKVYKGRKALAHALNDTKTAVKQLNTLVTVILIAIIIIVWLLLTGIATTKVLVLLSSQLVVAVFMFGNTCKTIFEAIIFVFVMHPFDVGDRCVIDGVQMIVLATKPISNFYRSPDMGDSLEFCIDFRTPLEKIGSLKERIKKYLEKNPQHWHPNHSVVVREIENVNKIKMALFFNHTMNFQDFAEKSRRKTDLVLEMKKIFEELSIGYDLLPQEVRLMESKTGTASDFQL
ncbi:hypothetical protein OROHE_019845 [Orobanche hederae]